jgi:hypothetical protein
VEEEQQRQEETGQLRTGVRDALAP